MWILYLQNRLWALTPFTDQMAAVQGTQKTSGTPRTGWPKRLKVQKEHCMFKLWMNFDLDQVFESIWIILIVEIFIIPQAVHRPQGHKAAAFQTFLERRPNYLLQTLMWNQRLQHQDRHDDSQRIGDLVATNFQTIIIINLSLVKWCLEAFKIPGNLCKSHKHL